MRLRTVLLAGTTRALLCAVSLCACAAAQAEGPGSRLTDSVLPVTTIDRKALEQSGVARVEDLLSQLPEIIPQSAETSDPVSLDQSYNLRGLGTSRTLVLLDGRRMAPGDPFAPALAQVPLSLIERIDVVKGGGSPLYGSDAVAGVINLITRSDFEGLRAGAHASVAETGSGAQGSVDLLYGINFAGQGNLTLFGSAQRQDRQGRGEFDFSRVAGARYFLPDDSIGYFTDPSLMPADSFLIQPGGSDVTPWGTLRSAPGNPFRNLWPALPAFGNVDLDCDPATPNVDVTSGTVSFAPDGSGLQPFFGNGRCGIPLQQHGSSRYNDAGDYDFLSAYDRFNLGGSLSYDFSEVASGHVFASWTRYETQVRSSPVGISEILVPADSPFIPDDLRTALDERFYPDAPFYVARRFNEFGPRIDEYRYDYLTLKASIDWSLGGGLALHTGGGYAGTEMKLEARNLVDGGALSDGLFDCPSGAAAGCVPLDIFGPGTLTEPMTEYLRTEARMLGERERWWLNAELGGTLFDLGAGPATFLLGAEYREETADRHLVGTLSGGYGFVPPEPLHGGYDVREAYADIRIPLVADSFIDSMTLELGYRYSDYNADAHDFSSDAYRIGLDFSPIRDIRFRGSYDRSVRAPNIEDLFAPTGRNPEFYADPCNAWNTERNEAACRETGVPDAFLDAFFQLGSQTDVLSGGGTALEEERWDTFTIGAVIQPRFLPRLSLAADYFNMTVENAIADVGAGWILERCYDLGDATACDRVERDGEGQIELIDATLINAERIETSGIDFELNYVVPIGGGALGETSSLGFNVTGTWQDEFVREILELNGIGCGGFGTICEPVPSDWRWNASVTWLDGPFSARFGWRHFSSVSIEDPFNGEVLERLPSVNYFDLALTTQIGDQFSFRIGVNNLFDQEPPAAAPFRIGRSYDQLGRYAFAGVSFDF